MKIKRVSIFSKLKVLILISVCVLIFFWPVYIQSKIIFPGDMLVGAYFPWLESKWGTTTGVAIKNPYLSDIFSQIYLWKELITESYLNWQWPLWNPYSFSGYPLLANFQSGALSPFNLIFIIFGMINGWNLYLIFGVLYSVFTMFFYLRNLNFSPITSLISSLSFSFSGFSILWMPYANANYALGTIPLILFFIDKYIHTANKKFLFSIPLLIFILITSGHLQITVYGLFTVLAYATYRTCLTSIQLTPNLFSIIFSILFGILISAPQLLPTFELAKNSIRFTEGFIESANYGLSPPSKLITILIPDYFGNPTTYNYWGFFNYHETNFYIGLLGLIALLWSILNYSRLENLRFFVWLSLICLIIGFSNPLSQLIYPHLPYISTSAAGRVASIFSLSSSILIAPFLKFYTESNKKLFPNFFLLALLLIVSIISFFTLSPEHLHVAIRNTIYPLLILCSLTICLFFYRTHQVFLYFILVIVMADLYRFGWKSTPFVPKNYVYPITPLITFFQNDHSLYRIEREYGPILPPNTWTHYHLNSPSGYDPLAISNYVAVYNQKLNLNPSLQPKPSRYTELFNFDSIQLGFFNVKYLLLQKNYKNPDSFLYNSKFNPKDWKNIFDTNNYTVFQNNNFRPRLETVPLSISSDLTEYQPNHLSIKIKNQDKLGKIIIRDTYYPGWQAKINNQPVTLSSYDKIFRQINLPQGNYQLDLNYQPQSFYNGLIISLFAIISLLIIYLLYA